MEKILLIQILEKAMSDFAVSLVNNEFNVNVILISEVYRVLNLPLNGQSESLSSCDGYKGYK